MISYFEFAGLNENSTPEEVKKRKKALFQIYHPDKGGSVILSQLINKAFEMINKGCGNQKLENLTEDKNFKHLVLENEKLITMSNLWEKERNRIKVRNKELNSEYNNLKIKNDELYSQYGELHSNYHELKSINAQLMDDKKRSKFSVSIFFFSIILLSCILFIYIKKPVVEYVDRTVIEYIDKAETKKVETPVTEHAVNLPKQTVTKNRPRNRSLLAGDYDWKVGYYANTMPFTYTKKGRTRLLYDCSGYLQYRTPKRVNVKTSHSEFVTNKESRDMRLNEYIYFLKQTDKHIKTITRAVGNYRINNIAFSTDGATKATNWINQKCVLK